MESSLITEDLDACLATLCGGGSILYPTDTVWGVGCDSRNADAVESLFLLKQRPEAKAMLLLAADVDMIARFVSKIPEAALAILKRTDRPTTIIYPGAHGVAPNLLASDGSVGIRIPQDDFCRELCRHLDAPVVSTSANVSGRQAPADFDEIAPEIIFGVDYVCKAKRADHHSSLPSDIYKISDSGEIIPIRVAGHNSDSR